MPPNDWQDSLEALVAKERALVADAARLLAIERAAQTVADCGWALGVPENYHHERMAKMDKLRKALEVPDGK